MIAAHLEPDLEHQFRIKCAVEGVTIKDKLTEMIQKEVEDEDVPVRSSLR